MRLGFICTDYEKLVNDLPGIAKKVDSQIDALRTLGIDVDLLALSSKETLWRKITWSLPLFKDGFDWDSLPIGKYDAFYIRRPAYVSKELLTFIRAVKLAAGDKKILYEVPTFPYDQEFNTVLLKPLLLRDRVNRRKLARYVDRIVSMTYEAEIFGIPNIHIFNGIDLDLVSVRECGDDYENAEINVICVATFMPWHGIDRFVQGMIDYQKSTGGCPVKLHLVGEGAELAKIKSLVETGNLASCVIFHGKKSGRNLDAVYDSCSLAVASLGMHRIGLSIASTLKTREYLAKGMPFAYSGDIDVFLEEPVDFCLKLPEGDDPVDMARVIDFHNQLYDSKHVMDVARVVREYAAKHVDMKSTMKPVAEFVMEGVTK